MQLAPTPRDSLFSEGTATLYRFRASEVSSGRAPVLLVPSLINRWYVLDLRPGASLARALVDAGFDVYCLDWGVPEAEDRYLDWDAVVGRVGRMVRRVQRESGAPRVGLLGYCIGGTLAAIHTALEPDSVAGLVNLAGPIDFAEGGFLAHMVNPRWFDPQAIADAGNVSAQQMQSGFVALRPTAQLGKWLSFFDRLGDPERLEAYQALEEWASANIPFPGAAYAKYIRDLYQENALARGEHHVAGRRVRLGDIRCPVLTVVTDRDVICPPPAAQALNDLSSSSDKSLLVIPGGHVGAVVGGSAPKQLYPKLAEWFGKTLAN
ncbi:MAG: alpha/beta fold hydrolase [Polyangiaceae bacterium]|nr:alpha/beta fold hydrolase [Polyangiaceae bacterium]MCE7890244.1 alpha/beta fold hydrolase [Sorangiineae bacterium PRO1]MCL4750543.1 alpha/beta fold hydrolase [Myxococcales bacterium]